LQAGLEQVNELMKQTLNILQTEACQLSALLRLPFAERALISMN
jgi:hypothetical protein